MPCYHPRNAGFDHEGHITFSEKRVSQERPTFKLPCGKCIGCRLERSREWAVRCVHESEMHHSNIFITLTYSPEHLPKTKEGLPTLFHEDFQNFMKRLRTRFADTQKEIGFFMCGEYGEQHGRPHYHACLFGVDFKDKEPERMSHDQFTCYTSKTLDELWGKGRTEIGSVTFESAAYIARYVTKKITGDTAPEHYQGRLPEYGKSSRQYAIGKKWLEKYWTDIFNYNELIIRGGVRSKIPRYYVKWIEKNQFDTWVKYKTRDLSHLDTWEYKNENSIQRLRVKKYIKQQKIKTLSRKFEA
jgi:hypothetical protein